MLRPPVLLCLLLLAGCSTSGGGATGGGATGGGSAGSPSPATTAPAAAPPTGAATGPSGGAKAVPAEKNPPGDIPDNIAFVIYRNRVGRYAFTHPEGWSESTRTSTVRFTDKLNGVEVLTGPATSPPTVGTAKQKDVPALASTQPAFELRAVAAVTVPGGTGARIVYRRNSAPDPVTGRQYRDEVERYELVSQGREVVMELFGPVGADNVDAYKTMVDSLRLT